MAAAVMEVAYVPPEGGLWAHALSRLMAAITFHPRGLVPGDAVPAIVARATHYLEAGDLEQVRAGRRGAGRGSGGRVHSLLFFCL